MSKKIVITGIVVVLLISILYGCISTGPDDEKFLGKWKRGDVSEGEEGSVIFTFFSNETYSINATIPDGKNETLTTETYWDTYEITDGKLIMYMVGVKEILTYSFSDDGNTLTLKEEDGTPTVLIRDIG